MCEAPIDGTFGGYCGRCSDRALGDDSYRDDEDDGLVTGSECALCFKRIGRDERAVELKRGQHAHEDCEGDFAGWCARCGDPATLDAMPEGADTCNLCLEDLSPCPSCGELAGEDELVARPDGTTACWECDQPRGS